MWELFSISFTEQVIIWCRYRMLASPAWYVHHSSVKGATSSTTGLVLYWLWSWSAWVWAACHIHFFSSGVKWHLGCNKDHFSLCKAEEFFSVSSSIFGKGSQFFFNLAHIRNWERHMNPCRALASATSLRGNVFALGTGRWKWGGNLFWGFGVIVFCFGGRRARGWGLVSGSFFSRAVRRRLICLVKTGG